MYICLSMRVCAHLLPRARNTYECVFNCNDNNLLKASATKCHDVIYVRSLI